MSLAAISMDQVDVILNSARQIQAVAVALTSHNALAEMTEQILSELFSIFLKLVGEIIAALKA